MTRRRLLLSTESFVPLSPARVLDTRGGAKVGNAAGTGAPYVLQVLGKGGVPSSGVGAVALNVTVTLTEDPTVGGGYVTVFPCGTRPDASNLNFVGGQTIANSVIAPVSASGEVCFYVYGTAHLIADVSGYFPTGSGFASLSPARVLDTRGGAKVGNAAGTGAPYVLQVLGKGGVPSSGVGAVALNVTVTLTEDPTVGGGYVTVFPCGTRPDASNLNFVGGQTIANSVIAPVSASGEVCFYVYGTAHLIADVSGYFPWSVLPQALAQVDIPPGSYRELYNGAWATAEGAFLYRTASGNFGVAAVDDTAKTIKIVSHDASTFARIGTSTTLSYDGWDDFGGMYVAPNGDLYLLVGRLNDSEDDNLDVVEVRRYSPTLQLVGAARVKGGLWQGTKGISVPFRASAADMLLVGDRLVVHMGRSMYRSTDGLRHQGNFTFEVNVNTMVATSFEQLGGYSYSSHSFRQLLATDGSNLFLADHGDAYPRAIKVGVMADYPIQRTVDGYNVFPLLNGDIGDNFTGATLMAMEASSAGALVVGNSTRQQLPWIVDPQTVGAESRNVYVATLVPNTGTYSMKWLTDFPATGGATASEPRMIKLGEDRFAVLFTVVDGDSYQTEYRLLDGTASVIASKTFPDMRFQPIAEPILVGNRIGWVGRSPDRTPWSPPSPAFLFAIDITSPGAPTLLP